MKQLLKINEIFMVKVILLLAFIGGSQSLFAQAPDSVWSKIYPGMVIPYKGSVAQTLDGGYIIISTNVIRPATEGAYIVKTNSSGDTIWTKIFQSGVYAQSFHGHDILQKPDGNYIICGSYQPQAQGPFHGLLYRLNSYGESTLEKYFPAPVNYAGIYFRSIKLTSDSGYVCGGAAYGNSPNHHDACIYKVDSVGYLQWSKLFGETNEEVAFTVKQLSQANGYVLSGRTKSLSSFYNNAYLIKTDGNGDSIWTRSYGEADEHNVFTDVVETSDGNFLSVGYKTITNYYHLYMVKTSNVGDTLWTLTYHDNPNPLYNVRAFSVLETADHSGYIVAGNGANDSLLVLKTDALGAILWTKKIQLGTNEFAQKIIQTSDGGFLIQGFTKIGPSASPYKLFLLKLKMGPSSLNKKPTLISTASLSYNYPNPFNPSTTILYSLNESAFVCLKVYNILGEKVKTLVNEYQNKNTYSIHFNASDLPSGVYYYRLQVGNKISETKKMIVLK